MTDIARARELVSAGISSNAEIAEAAGLVPALLDALDAAEAARRKAEAERDAARDEARVWAQNAGYAEAEVARLTDALHDAINSPKGVVPASADPFYDPTRYTRGAKP